MLNRRTLLARGLGALVAVSGLERFVPAAPAEAVDAQALLLSDWAPLRRQVLAGSGGLCAPIAPYYSLHHLDAASRPIRDALPAFKAAPGVISFKAESDG